MANDKNTELTTPEREEVLMKLYQEFERKFSKESKTLSALELEHLRCDYVDKNLYQASLDYKNKK